MGVRLNSVEHHGYNSHPCPIPKEAQTVLCRSLNLHWQGATNINVLYITFHNSRSVFVASGFTNASNEVSWQIIKKQQLNNAWQSDRFVNCQCFLSYGIYVLGHLVLLTSEHGISTIACNSHQTQLPYWWNMPGLGLAISKVDSKRIILWLIPLLNLYQIKAFRSVGTKSVSESRMVYSQLNLRELQWNIRLNEVNCSHIITFQIFACKTGVILPRHQRINRLVSYAFQGNVQ